MQILKPTKQSFSLIIPVFNEKDGIVPTLTHIRQSLADVNVPYEVIVVDDGSTDGTRETLTETLNTGTATNVTLLKHVTNTGYGAALKTGIRAAQYDIIVITDADETYPNAEIPAMLELLTEEISMVIGARTKKRVQIPLVRRPAKWVIQKLAEYLLAQKIPDLNSGLRVMRKPVVERFINMLPNGFSFTTTITMAMLASGLQVVFYPIDYFARRGSSKIRPIKDTMNFVNIVLTVATVFNPLKIFMPITLLALLFFLSVLTMDIMRANITDKTVIAFFIVINTVAVMIMSNMVSKK